jgi:hypothetical protein
MKLLTKIFNIFKKDDKEKFMNRYQYQTNVHKLIYNRDFQAIAGKYKIFDMWQHVITVEHKGNHVIFYKNNKKSFEIWKSDKFNNKEGWERILLYDL